MASAEEVLAQIDATKAKTEENSGSLTTAASSVDETFAQAGAARAKVEELADQLGGMGIHDKAGVAGGVVQKIGEAEQAATALKSQVENLQTAVGRIRTLLDEAYAEAQSLAG